MSPLGAVAESIAPRACVRTQRIYMIFLTGVVHSDIITLCVFTQSGGLDEGNPASDQAHP